ncbi:hypothetical protein NHX12_010494 [Muraenolepis orangiensis]|uniref:Ig-like domain-containing protein n=1 Tax=Muraenolepis orangiensis TaxID=630683 RepID=A0A9Q0DLA9_9TELE|nr:hypothetical protein NHX12_010494 [Muraenolepis orangiensis]
MKKEIAAVVFFLKRLIKKGEKLAHPQVEKVVERLTVGLQEKFRGHWYPENPRRGQACIRVNRFQRFDPVLLRACQESEVQYSDLSLPRELTLWVDPGEVSCRYGEQNPHFSVASFSDGDEHDKEVTRKVTSAVERVTSDYHSGSSSDEDSTLWETPSASPLTVAPLTAASRAMNPNAAPWNPKKKMGRSQLTPGNRDEKFDDGVRLYPIPLLCDDIRSHDRQLLKTLLGFSSSLMSASVHPGMVSSLEITSPVPKSIEIASGQSVKLECQFTLAPEDLAPLDIEWSLLASDNQKEDKVVILYSGDRSFEDYPVMKGRVHFNSADPKNGDASINLTGLRSTDTGTYQCKVKKAPGIRSRKIPLTVMVRPSRPRCYAEGPTEEGKDVLLRCMSKEGTNPMQYTWEKISDTKLLPATAVLEECILNVKITPPPNTAGIVAGAIIGVLLFLFILAIILFCCCRARQKKKYEKEICNEIREDVPPPKSRVSTARSFTSVGSHRSSLGSMTPSNMHEYALKPQYDKIPSHEDFDRPPSRAPVAPPSLLAPLAPAPAPRVAGPNLSRMGGIAVMIPAQNRDGSIV